MVMPTTATTHSTVRTRIPGTFGSWRSALKFLVPADPIVTPIGVMFCIDVWTRATMGHSTTTAINAVAGPSQASGSRRRRFRRARPARCGRRGEVARPCCSPAVSSAAATSGMPFSAAAGGGLLDRVEDRLRITGDRLAQRCLDLVLHRGPVGLGRVVHRIRDVLQEGREHQVLGHAGSGALGGWQQVILIVELKLVLVLIHEVEELLDRGFVPSGV